MTARLLPLLLLPSCFGSLTIGANMKIEPHLILPGSTATLAIEVDGDGLLGSAIRQQLTPASFENSRMNGASWDLRDNSDSQRVRLRATSSVDFPANLDAAKLPGTGVDGISVVTRDYVVYRTYTLLVTLPPSQSSTTTGASTDQFSQQAAAAALAAVRYQWSAALPGSVQSTNGLRSDDGRIVWQLNISSQQATVLRAESTYIDWPRIAVITAIAIGVLLTTIFRRARARRRSLSDGVSEFRS